MSGIGGFKPIISSSAFMADCYDMDHMERGRAIIFNNKMFHPSTGMGERTGTDVDAENLFAMLNEMGFDTIVKNDYTAREMESMLVKGD